jgi:tRNA intron endonuclease, catalytic C-terminal domain
METANRRTVVVPVVPVHGFVFLTVLSYSTFFTTVPTPSQRMGETTSFTLPTALLVCTSSLVQRLTEERIPTNFVGVRNVHGGNHPTTEEELDAEGSVVIVHRRRSRGGKVPSIHVHIPITYKLLTPDGTERRMTRQEKKAARMQMVQQKRQALEGLKQQQHQQQQQQLHDDNASSLECDQECPPTHPPPPPSAPWKPSVHNNDNNNNNNDNNTSNKELRKTEEGLAERRDRREGRAPVLVAPPMALFASSLLLRSVETTTNRVQETDHETSTAASIIYYDHELSQTWATLLKESMLPAETVRGAEDMRPMAYQLTPEPWTRLRPEHHITHPTKRHMTNIHPGTPTSVPSALTIHNSKDPSPGWVELTCRPSSALDVANAILFEYLYKETGYHVSCGAKFGADFLLYDGPRSQRHAFGGLRMVLPSTEGTLPLPSTYEMTGYVRCLNTAGKLALLATVVQETVHDEIHFKIAFVDVALEKVLSAPTHQRSGRREKRRDVSKNLDKN